MYALFYAAIQCFATEAETEEEVYQLALVMGWEEELKSGQAYILPIGAPHRAKDGPKFPARFNSPKNGLWRDALRPTMKEEGEGEGAHTQSGAGYCSRLGWTWTGTWCSSVIVT